MWMTMTPSWLIRAVVTTVAVTVAGVAVAWLVIYDPSPGTEGPAATTALAFVPHLAIGTPGWSIRAVDGTPAYGRIVFRGGSHVVEVSWAPATDHAARLAAVAVAEPTTTSVLGRPAVTFVSDTTDRYVTLVEPEPGMPYFLQTSGDLDELDAYLDIVGSLTVVPIDQWFTDLPADVTLPAGDPLTDESEST